MFKTSSSKYVLPELIVSEKMSILYKNPDFCHQYYKKIIIQVNCPLGSLKHYSTLLAEPIPDHEWINFQT